MAKPKVALINSFVVEWWEIERPKDYPLNARKWKPAAVAKVADSIKRYGWRQPIVVDDAGVIVIGHLRRAAARQAGLGQVPVHIAAGLSPEAVRGLRLADNRTHDEAEWDMELLAREFGELKALDFDLGATAFSLREIDTLTLKPNAAEDDVPPVPEVPITKPGDLWLLGDHRLLCGDSMDAASVGRLMGGDKADVTVIDPPFDMDSRWTKHLCGPCIVFGQLRQMRLIPEDLFRFERVIDKVTAHRSASTQILQRHALVAQCGEVKTLPATAHSYDSIVVCADRPDHPHQKPVSLLVEHLTAWTPEWKTLFDPFAGSGSSLMACEQIGGKRWRGIEISPAYCDVIIARWKGAMGGDAVLQVLENIEV